MPARKRPYKLYCPRCKKDFEPKRTTSIFCSDFCARNRWKTEEKHYLWRRVYSGGETCKEAAESLGRSFSAVSARCRLLGINRGKTGRPADVYKRAALAALLDGETSLSKAARLLGVSPASVRKMALKLVKLGILIKVGSGTKARYRRAHEEYEEYGSKKRKGQARHSRQRERQSGDGHRPEAASS